MIKINVIIPTYQRDELLRQCVNSILNYIPSDMVGKIIVIDQNAATKNQGLLPRTEIIRAEPGLPGLRRKLGAKEITPAPNEFYLFLDDDIEVNNSLVRLPELLKKAVLFHFAGYVNWRCGFVWAKHKFGSSGGIKSYFNIASTANIQKNISNLDTIYPGKVVKDNSWMGFKVVR